MIGAMIGAALRAGFAVLLRVDFWRARAFVADAAGATAVASAGGWHQLVDACDRPVPITVRGMK